MARDARLLVAALATILGVGALSGSAAGQALPSDSLLIQHWDGAAWTVTPTARPHGGSILNAVTIVSPTNLWAVGSNARGRTVYPLVEHYSGTAWYPLALPTPTSKAQSDLLAVSASSAKDVWAVGTTGHDLNSTVHTLIEHYNGKAWTLVRSSHKTASELAGVAAVSPRDAWAVGQFLPPGGRYHAFVEQWNGSAWREVPIPHPGGPRGYETLDAVSALSPRNVWAVGDYQRGRLYHTLILHWNGSRWRRVPSPTLAPRHESLVKGVVVLGRNNAWAVGSYPGKHADRPLTEHWDGHGWHVVTAPSTSSFNLLVAVSAASPTDVWAAGLDLGGIPAKTLVEHWDGHSWTVSVTPPPLEFDTLSGIAAVSNTDVWAVGDSNAP